MIDPITTIEWWYYGRPVFIGSYSDIRVVLWRRMGRLTLAAMAERHTGEAIE